MTSRAPVSAPASGRLVSEPVRRDEVDRGAVAGHGPWHPRFVDHPHEVRRTSHEADLVVPASYVRGLSALVSR